MNSSTNGGGTNDPTRLNEVPVLVLHAKFLNSAPASPQSSHDRFIAPGGSGPTRNVLSETVVPPGPTTVIGPLVVPDGTVAWITESEGTTKVAGVPLNNTELALVKLKPRIEIGL